MTYLHFGGASTASVVVAVVTIFFLMFAMSFAVGPMPQGQRRFSREWASAWFKASLPRIIVAGGFSAALFVASSFSGNNSGNVSGLSASVICQSPIGALSNTPLSKARIESAADNMALIADAATNGDLVQAQTLFFGETHNLTHDIDTPLRQVDEGLARALCDNVLTLEQEMPRGTPNMDLIATSSQGAAGQLGEAADELGNLFP